MVNVALTPGQINEQETLAVGPSGHHLRIEIGANATVSLEPDQTVIVNYDVRTDSPHKDNTSIPAPAMVEFGASINGPTCERSNFDTPLLDVKHKRRKFTTGKEIFPAGPPGTYEVIVLFQNRSDNPLQDLAITDISPEGFEITSATIKSSIHGELSIDEERKKTPEGVVLTWVVPIIDCDEEIEVCYEIEGDPSIEFKASEVQTILGGSGGSEIDDAETTSPPSAESEVEVEVGTMDEGGDNGEEEAPASEETVAEEILEEPVAEFVIDDEVGDKSEPIPSTENDPMEAQFEAALGSLGSITSSASSDDKDSSSSE